MRIKDRGQAKLIALQAADTPRNTRFGEASGIDRIGQSGIVRGADPCIRVAQQNRSRVDIAARKVCDAGPGTGSRGTRLQNVARRARLTGCQVSLSGTNRVGTTTVGEVQAIVVAKRLWLAGGIRCSAGDLIIIKQKLDQPVLPMMAQLGYIIDVVNRKNVRLIEIRRAIVKCFVRAAIKYVAGIVVLRVVKSL